MELKPGITKAPEGLFNSSNRTFMELKPDIRMEKIKAGTF